MGQVLALRRVPRSVYFDEEGARVDMTGMRKYAPKPQPKKPRKKRPAKKSARINPPRPKRR